MPSLSAAPAIAQKLRVIVLPDRRREPSMDWIISLNAEAPALPVNTFCRQVAADSSPTAVRSASVIATAEKETASSVDCVCQRSSVYAPFAVNGPAPRCATLNIELCSRFLPTLGGCAACTNAVVAIEVSASPAIGVGAVGLPVKTGEASGAPPAAVTSPEVSVTAPVRVFHEVTPVPLPVARTHLVPS